MSVYNMRGSRFYIGGPIVIPTSGRLIQSDYASQVWLQVSGAETLGAVGRSASTSTVELMDSTAVFNMKGLVNGASMQSAFAADYSDPGQAKMREALESCEHYAFRLVMSRGCRREAVVTISNATPGVVSWTGHGLANGSLVRLATTGTLPTGLSPETDYYVVGASANTFSLAATIGGSAINTTGAGSGVHTASAVPAGRQALFAGLVISDEEPGGNQSASQLANFTIQQHGLSLVRF